MTSFWARLWELGGLVTARGGPAYQPVRLPGQGQCSLRNRGPVGSRMAEALPAERLLLPHEPRLASPSMLPYSYGILPLSCSAASDARARDLASWSQRSSSGARPAAGLTYGRAGLRPALTLHCPWVSSHLGFPRMSMSRPRPGAQGCGLTPTPGAACECPTEAAPGQGERSLCPHPPRPHTPWF